MNECGRGTGPVTGCHTGLMRLASILVLCACSAACGQSAPAAEAHPAPAATPAPEEATSPRAETPAATPAPTEAQADDTPRVRALVKLIILGTFPDELADAAQEGLEDELQVEVERIDGLELPESAYYPPRRRYRADRLLEFLNEHLSGEPATTRVLGLTSVDISTTKGPHRDWGVFGLGELGGRSCVISTFRLRRRARSPEHFEFRIVTTAIHEVGHTLGLEHCTEPACIMRDAEGSIRTVDTGDGHMGPDCRAELDRESPQTLPVSVDDG